MNRRENIMLAWRNLQQGISEKELSGDSAQIQKKKIWENIFFSKQLINPNF